MNLRRKMSEETKAKMSKAKRGITKPQEVKDKIRAKMLANWATIPIPEATPELEAGTRESQPQVITFNLNEK
jgi:hypothetical protein